ncbi:MAG: hypothetical protein DMG93_07275 [Acidobacteria bacterium]|nr:MAG: hypothetical protein DMG93_07275 [Acidobacteriota bacterium]
MLKMNDLACMATLLAAVPVPKIWLVAVITLVFAVFGRLVHGVTTSGAVAGGVVCFALFLGAGWGGFSGLCAVFVLTWAATRFGYARKQSSGTAEARSGRTALQVLANLGIATICAIAFVPSGNSRLLVALGAALAEAAGDTVSSEIGEAIGGTPRLITTRQESRPGTDGAVTWAGTAAGIAAALAVGAAYAFTEQIGWHGLMLCALAGILGTFFDSLLGATIERRGLIGNNTVNFLSTLAAAAIGFATG